MIKIAVVDDNEFQIEQITAIVSDFFYQRNILIKIDDFFNGESLLSKDYPYDIIFLDIQMNGINGIETAQYFRLRHKESVFFFVTSYPDYIQKSMTVHPFAFITKPVLKCEIIKNLEDYLLFVQSLIQKDSKEVFMIHSVQNRHYPVNIESIQYFCYSGNRIVEIFMLNYSDKIKSSLEDIYSSLNHKYFIVPHRSFIVNLRYVKEIDGRNKKIVMQNGDLILIARKKYNKVIEDLSNYITQYSM